RSKPQTAIEAIAMQLTTETIREELAEALDSPAAGKARPPRDAFNNAIAQGVLSKDPAHKNYAGNYMYMYTEANHDFFKHIVTRKYTKVPFQPAADPAR